MRIPKKARPLIEQVKPGLDALRIDYKSDENIYNKMVEEHLIHPDGTPTQFALDNDLITVVKE